MKYEQQYYNAAPTPEEIDQYAKWTEQGLSGLGKALEWWKNRKNTGQVSDAEYKAKMAEIQAAIKQAELEEKAKQRQMYMVFGVIGGVVALGIIGAVVYKLTR